MAFWLVGVILVVLLSLFAYIDVWYFLRFITFFLSIRIKRISSSMRKLTREELLKEHVTQGVVMPSDLDFNLHMNNSKYLRELDFGRFGLYVDKGLREILIRRGAVFLVNAISIRYRRSLQLFQKFEVHTKILAWDEKVLYLEQRLITTSDNFVAAIALVKMAIKGITTPELIRIMCGQMIASPAPSSELKMWQESINLSSKHLREENSAATVEGFNTKHHSDKITNRPLTKRQ